ncbi:MAG: hypothetical protein ABJA16_06515 [Nakamurella sp.]
MRTDRPGDRADIVFLLPALRGQLRGAELIADERKRTLLVEYACWNRHMEDWRSRQLGARRRLDQPWLDEGRVLFEQLDVLRAAARHTGVLC